MAVSRARALIWVLQLAAAAAVYWAYPNSLGWRWPAARPWVALAAAYLVQYFDGSEKTADGRIWPWFQRLGFWGPIVRSIPHTFALPSGDKALRFQGQYIFSMHPHGVISANHLATMTDGSGFLSNIHGGPRRDVVASVLFMIPFVREIMLWLGNVDAGRKTFSAVLKSGKTVLVYTGGEAEQMRSQLGEHTVYVNRRKGFIRLAVDHGVPVVPIYVFGETDLYRSSNFLLGVRMWMVHHLRIALPLFWGRFPWPCWRKGVTFRYAFGAPVQPPSRDEVSSALAGVDTGSYKARRDALAALVDGMHARFVAELQATFERERAAAGYPKGTLTVL